MTSMPAAAPANLVLDPETKLRLDAQLCFPLYAASNLLTRRYGPLLKKIGLTYPQYLVMLVLWERAPCLVTELGRALYLDTGTLTPLLKRLQQAGLIERRRETSDERKVMITLSEQGAALREKAAAVPDAIACLLPYDAEQAVRMRDELRELVGVLASKIEDK